MKNKAFLFFLFFFLLLMVVPVFAQQTIYQGTITLSQSGYVDPNEYIYVTLNETCRNGEIDYYINVANYTGIFQVYNLTEVTLNISKCLKDYNINPEVAFRSYGKLTVTVNSNQPLNITLIGVPTPKEILKNGVAISDYVYDSATSTLTLTVTGTTYTIHFTTYAMMFVPLIVAFAMLSICIGFIKKAVG